MTSEQVCGVCLVWELQNFLACVRVSSLQLRDLWTVGQSATVTKGGQQEGGGGEIGERGDVSWQVNDWLIQWAHADELEQQQHALHEGRVRAAGPRSAGFLVLTSEHVQLSVRKLNNYQFNKQHISLSWTFIHIFNHFPLNFPVFCCLSFSCDWKHSVLGDFSRYPGSV